MLRKRHIVFCLATCCMMACTSPALREAQETVTQADSLWLAGKAYTDSAGLAQAYKTLKHGQYFHADEYAHACYHYGKLLRAKEDPAAAMECFINATHARTRDYHILGRVYSNMGSICHLANEFSLSYDMYSKSSDLFLQNGDTLNYYYALNDMAFELAWQKKKKEAYGIMDIIHKHCKDVYVFAKTIETKAIACKMAEQYDSTLYYTSQSLALGFSSSTILLNRAQAFSLMGMKDSAVHYATLLLSVHADIYDQCNALYILTQEDTTQNISEVRVYAADRADTQKLIEHRRSRCAQAVQLLEQDLLRKPDLTWLYAIIATLVIVGASIGVYVRNKRKKNLLLAQTLNYLKQETSAVQVKHDEITELYLANHKHIEEEINSRCSILQTNESIIKTLAWKNYCKMCNIVDKRFYLLASKLRDNYSLNETEVRICILTLLKCGNEQMAELLYKSRTSIGTLKRRVAIKLGTTSGELRSYLIDSVCLN